MPESFLESQSTLHTRGQRLLIDFLHTDLDLAFTVLQTASIEAGFDDAGAEAAIEKAQTALNSVRWFQGRIEDLTQWQTIQDRANALEAAISAFKK